MWMQLLHVVTIVNIALVVMSTSNGNCRQQYFVHSYSVIPHRGGTTTTTSTTTGSSRSMHTPHFRHPTPTLLSLRRVAMIFCQPHTDSTDSTDSTNSNSGDEWFQNEMDEQKAYYDNVVFKSSMLQHVTEYLYPLNNNNNVTSCINATSTRNDNSMDDDGTATTVYAVL